MIPIPTSFYSQIDSGTGIPTGSILGYWDTFFPDSFPYIGNNVDVPTSSIWYDLSGNNYHLTYSNNSGGEPIKYRLTAPADSFDFAREPCFLFEGQSYSPNYFQLTGSQNIEFLNAFGSGSRPEFTVLVYCLNNDNIGGDAYSNVHKTTVYIGGRAYTIITGTFETTIVRDWYRTYLQYSGSATTQFDTNPSRAISGSWGLQVLRNLETPPPLGDPFGDKFPRFEFTSSQGNRYQYKDGPTNNNALTTPTPQFWNNTAFKIGGEGPEQTPVPRHVGWRGQIQAVVIYTRTLSDAEVTQALTYFTNRISGA
jgi:hypothetical protein